MTIYSQKTFVSVVLSFLLFFSTNAFSFIDEENAKIAMRFLDKGELSKAKTVLDKAVKATPNSAPVLYQLARHQLKTQFKSDSSFIGFKYTQQGETQAISILEKVLKIDSNYGDAYSLLGHIYAIQGKTAEAKKPFDHAQKLSTKPAWLDYNMALLAIQQGEFKQATDLLTPYTKARGPVWKSKPMRVVQSQLYAASWGTLRSIISKYPEFDPIEEVRKGQMKRVNADELGDFLKSAKNGDKRLFLHFSSSDEGCQPCATENKNLTKLMKVNAKKFQFVYVSFEPWNTINYFDQTQVKPVKVTGLPFQIVYDKNGPTHYKSGANGTFETVKDSSRSNVKVPDKSDVMSTIEYHFKNQVSADKSHKAFAVVIDGDYWQTGMSSKRLTQKYAVTRALRQCENAKRKAGKTTKPCQLYGVGDQKVFGFSEAKIDQVIKGMTAQKLGPIDKIVATYKKQKKVKALAIAVDENHRWNTYYFRDSRSTCKTLDECKERVLAQCNNSRKKWKTSTPCQIYYENNTQVKELVWPDFK